MTEPIARRRATECCLIAADVDRTILDQTKNERSDFVIRMAPHLIEAARRGFNLAFITGNAMSELCDRTLRWLVDELCRARRLDLLSQFHFFCNSGGVYFHFPADDPDISAAYAHPPCAEASVFSEFFKTLTFQDGDGRLLVRPRFLDSGYLLNTRIPPLEVQEIVKVIEECGRQYFAELEARKSEFEQAYRLREVSDESGLIRPCVDTRPVCFGTEEAARQVTVQLTLKPVLSFQHAVNLQERGRLFQKDCRTTVIAKISRALSDRGFAKYIARAGGRSSIDVTLAKLDKAYALNFLIDHLNLQGNTDRGQKFGANAVYFGDEVVAGGGNDYAVTRIPGLTVFAVNPNTGLVPFLSHVFIPSLLPGPEAVADILSKLNEAADCLLAETDRNHEGRNGQRGTALDMLKTELFFQRIHTKIENLKAEGSAGPEDWQMLHAFVTLMHRQDPAARGWLAILVDQLDAIMTQITVNPEANRQTGPPAIGSSHRDS